MEVTLLEWGVMGFRLLLILSMIDNDLVQLYLERG